MESRYFTQKNDLQMIHFYLIYILLLLFSLLDRVKVIAYQKNAVFNIIYWILILFAGLRKENADWRQYCEIFEAAIKGDSSGLTADPLFNGLCWSLGMISSSPLILFLTVAYISVTLNLNSFKKYTPFFFTAILCYYSHMYLNKEMIQIRVGLASGICIFSIRYLLQDKMKKYYLLLLLAFCIHLTTIVWVLLPILYQKNIQKTTLLAFVLFSLIIGIYYPLGNIVKVFGYALNARLDSYINYGSEGYAASLGVFSNINIIKTLFLFLLFYIKYDLFKKIFPFFYPMFISYSIGLCWMLLFNDFSIIGARVSNVLLSVEPIMITYFYVIINRNVCWFAFCFFSFILMLQNFGEDKTVPYIFYFD